MSPLSLTIDIGTTWAKLAVCEPTQGQPRVLDSRRLPSGAGSHDGSRRSVASLMRFCARLERLMRDWLIAYPIHGIGLTGIREGLVLLDKSGRVLWVSGNALLDNELMLGCPISAIDIGGFIPGILSRHPSAHALVSLQGYLLYRWSRRLAVTGSEMDALGLLRDTNRRRESVQQLLEPVQLVGIGEPVGEVGPSGEFIYLAGTDEQASHHGAGVGVTADVGLATATFWSLTAPASRVPADLPQIRYIPAQPPYRAMASVIGYRYGPLLRQALAGEPVNLPQRLPRWAVGELLDVLRRTPRPARDRLLEAVDSDIRSALGLLSRVSDLPPTPTLAVHGGGLGGLRDFTIEAMERLGFPWVALEDDATQVGCCLAGMAAWD